MNKTKSLPSWSLCSSGKKQIINKQYLKIILVSIIFWVSITGNDNLLQYSCLEKSTDRGAWQATVHGIARVGHNLNLNLSFLSLQLLWRNINRVEKRCAFHTGHHWKKALWEVEEEPSNYLLRESSGPKLQMGVDFLHNQRSQNGKDRACERRNRRGQKSCGVHTEK